MRVPKPLSRVAFKASLLMSVLISQLALADPTADNYLRLCSSCHGPDLAGGFGSSLLDDTWVYGSSPEAISKTIRDGVLAKGMPAWGKTLNDDEITALTSFILNKGK
ncbi:cbb3-type cytochrome c oxidase subunit III [Alteromonadaceae bacterium 2753L.S.0a.02]|nr:cbb3-type cytochrome c oxidase subunit III [Alteromonadaceae bacterium 2753L.S.0a.02]